MTVEMNAIRLSDIAMMIEDLIRKYYHDYRIDTDSIANELLGCFEIDEIAAVLAVYIKDNEWDGRISLDNKRWAYKYIDDNNVDYSKYANRVIIQTNPGLINYLADKVISLSNTEPRKIDFTSLDNLDFARIDSNTYKVYLSDKNLEIIIKRILKEQNENSKKIADVFTELGGINGFRYSDEPYEFYLNIGNAADKTELRFALLEREIDIPVAIYADEKKGFLECVEKAKQTCKVGYFN